MIGGGWILRIIAGAAGIACIAGAFAALWLRLDSMRSQLEIATERAARVELRAAQMASDLEIERREVERLAEALDALDEAERSARKATDERRQALEDVQDDWCDLPLPDDVRVLFGVRCECTADDAGGPAAESASAPVEALR